MYFDCIFCCQTGFWIDSMIFQRSNFAILRCYYRFHFLQDSKQEQNLLFSLALLCWKYFTNQLMIARGHWGIAGFLFQAHWSLSVIFLRFFDGSFISPLGFHLTCTQSKDWSYQLNSSMIQVSEMLLFLTVYFFTWSIDQLRSCSPIQIDDLYGLSLNFC